MVEFHYGDRVRWVWEPHPLGTVIDERLPQANPVMGDYMACLPCPVAVAWDEPGEVWWESADNLELA